MSVNVHTEWAPLREVIVGNIGNWTEIHPDFSFLLFFHENIKDPLIQKSINLQKKLVEQRQEDLDGLADLLKSNDIIVHRPLPLEIIDKFKTQEFEDFPSPCDNPREQFLIIGDEIIETSCQWRRRYFENDLLKPVLYEYFNEGAKWTSSPRPIMGLNSFDFSHLDKSTPGIDWDNLSNDPDEYEIMFDGAQCLKFGKDIVFNVSTKNHELGYEWLKRHLGCKFNLHMVRITDHHLDGMFLPLRPGTLLINPISMNKKLDLLPEPLKSWDTLIVPEEHKEKYPEESILLASSNINVNVLSINEKQLLVFQETGREYSPLIRTLERSGFEPIPVQLRHSRLFGGGIHCATLDTVRDDSAEDYFN